MQCVDKKMIGQKEVTRHTERLISCGYLYLCDVNNFSSCQSSHCWYVRSGRIPASFHSRILFFNCLDICRASDTTECRRIRDSDFVPDMKCSLRLRCMYGEKTWPSVSVVFVHSWIVDVHHNQCPFWWLGCSLKFAFSFHFCWWSFFW